MNKIAVGLDLFREEYWKKFRGKRLGLLSNQASVDGSLTHAKTIIAGALPGALKALFGPQHGHRGEDQDNMIETDHSMDEELAIPVFSLYSKNREPLAEMLDMIDVLIIDLQDVGTRVYTFASTMLNCLRAASRVGKKVVVLDRPNPLGGEIIEGCLLRPDLYSFVGPYRFPMRHGLTMGEMAKIFDTVFHTESDPEVIPMKGWNRHLLWHESGLHWVMPSPNMPLPETAYVYPGQVIMEGTNLSEGRGTCRPFEIFGAPFLDTKLVCKILPQKATQGCYLREISYRPTFHKWEGERCRGFMIHILDNHQYRPFYTSIALLRAILETHGEYFYWKDPPYEYEYEKIPVDLILGDSELRRDLETGKDLPELEERWSSEIRGFVEWRRPYLLYE